MHDPVAVQQTLEGNAAVAASRRARESVVTAQRVASERSRVSALVVDGHLGRFLEGIDEHVGAGALDTDDEHRDSVRTKIMRE